MFMCYKFIVRYAGNNSPAINLCQALGKYLGQRLRKKKVEKKRLKAKGGAARRDVAAAADVLDPCLPKIQSTVSVL